MATASPVMSSTSPIAESASAPESLAALMASLPRHLRERSTSLSMRPLCTTLVLGALGYWLAATLPVYALPLVWALLGALFAGLSAIVGTFSPSEALNRVIGTVASLPLLVPFETLRVLNSAPRALANSSNASLSSFSAAVVERLARGPAWLLSAGVEWVRVNFSLSAWVPGSRRLLVAALCLQWAVAAWAVSTWGTWALVKYWLMPWCAYLVWRSVFLHGVYVAVPFTDTQVRVLVDIAKYPTWLRLLTNDVATVMAASRLFSAFVQQRVPNVHVRAALAYLLVSADAAVEEERERQRLLREEAACAQLEAQLDFGRPLAALPAISRASFQALGRARRWTACDGLVFDLTHFHADHPGGQAVLQPFYGNDCTRQFNGAVYNHSNAARNLSRHFMVARIVDEAEALPHEHVDAAVKPL